MKSNFEKEKETIDYTKYVGYNEVTKDERGLSKADFEEFVEKSGARGSFMVYRTTDKDDELGIDEL
jgi:hypothetical protein